jgi:hypothetical protein
MASLNSVVATPTMVTVIIMNAGAALQTDQSPQETDGICWPLGRMTLFVRFIEISGMRKLRKWVVSTLHITVVSHPRLKQSFV